jgi:glycosyltransferase involved in cell wall biosynthesis
VIVSKHAASDRAQLAREVPTSFCGGTDNGEARRAVSTRFGFISTFPPTQCGLATFTSSLRDALLSHIGDEGFVVRLVDAPESRPSHEVVAQIAVGDRQGLHDGLARLNECDVVIVQHEFGIYGGLDGEDILPMLDGLCVPSIVVLHTVLLDATRHQREVLEAIVAKTDAVVTMTATGRDRLAAGYDVDMRKVSVIAHGAPSMPAATARTAAAFRSGRPIVLTWGLLGPGKGIEWGIDAMAQLRDLGASYVVAGQTHPKVALREGEAYRIALQERARVLGLGPTVTFDGRYRDPEALAALVQSADIVLLPYDSVDQVTSGVLIEAVAAGKPVVATRFPHAVELLGDSAGILVTHRSPDDIAAALRTLLTQRELAARMARAAAAKAPHVLWPAVADQYRVLAAQLIEAGVAA